ncbi:fatty acid-binding protein-like [Antedon mediterranea]|uniref:fatty acid-binding protein-like n=1 Tax=Antedon mediterranea TaxID=105859 RepID=UPI003AF61F83
MVVNFAGKYKLSKSENFDEYMKAMGVGLAMRKMAGLMSPSCEVTQDGDDFEIKMNVPMVNTHVQKFKIGEPFQDLAPTGEKIMVIVSWDGDKLIFDDVDKTDPPHQIIRELDGEDMVVKCIKGEAVCRRVFKRT